MGGNSRCTGGTELCRRNVMKGGGKVRCVRPYRHDGFPVGGDDVDVAYSLHGLLLDSWSQTHRQWSVAHFVEVYCLLHAFTV